MGLEERDPRPGAASREAGRHPCGGSRSWGRRRGGAGSDRPNRSRQPAFPRAAPRVRPGGRPQRARSGSPDDRGTARRPTRASRPGRAGADRARLRRGPRLLARRAHRAVAAGGSRRTRLAVEDTCPSWPRPCPTRRRRRHVPLPSRSRPRRRLCRDDEGRSGRAARPFRHVARATRPGRGRDRRLPPRAGTSLPQGARPRRSWCRRPC